MKKIHLYLSKDGNSLIHREKKKTGQRRTCWSQLKGLLKTSQTSLTSIADIIYGGTTTALAEFSKGMIRAQVRSRPNVVHFLEHYDSRRHVFIGDRGGEVAFWQ